MEGKTDVLLRTNDTPLEVTTSMNKVGIVLTAMQPGILARGPVFLSSYLQ